MTTIPSSHRRNSRRGNQRRRHLQPVPAAPRPTLAGPEPRWTAVTIRLAVAADEPALRRLAQLDSAPPLSGQKLLAEQGGAPLAAVSLADARAIADPFTVTEDALALLRLRAAQLRQQPEPATAA